MPWRRPWPSRGRRPGRRCATFSRSSSGTEMSKRSSRPITSSTRSRLSASRSSLKRALFDDRVGLDAQHLDGDLPQCGERLVTFHRFLLLARRSLSCDAGGDGLGSRSSVAHAEAAVDRHERAGDVAGGVGAEEGDDGRHLLGGPEPPERHRLPRPSVRQSSGSPSVMAVTIGPGATTLQVMPRGASSRATARVRPTSPALAAA